MTNIVNLVYICHGFKGHTMKAFTLPYSNTIPLSGKQFAPAKDKGVQGSNGNRTSIVNYVIEALGEGLKQNFLGADIDIEFLTLTFRRYMIASANTLRGLVDKKK